MRQAVLEVRGGSKVREGDGSKVREESGEGESNKWPESKRVEAGAWAA